VSKGDGRSIVISIRLAFSGYRTGTAGSVRGVPGGPVWGPEPGHHAKRVTIMPSDIQLARHIQSDHMW